MLETLTSFPTRYPPIPTFPNPKPSIFSFTTLKSNPNPKPSNPLTLTPSFLHHKPSISAALSSKPSSTLTHPLPPKPSNKTLQPSNPNPQPSKTHKPSNPLTLIPTPTPTPTTPDHSLYEETLQPSQTLKPPNPIPQPHQPQTLTPTLHEKALYLDSLGLDSLTLLSSSALSTAISAASLTELRQLLDYLATFSISGPELRRVITMCPEILTLHLNDVVPVFTFLLREAHVELPDIRRVISRRPRLLISDVATRLRPTMYFLQSIGIHEVSRHTNLLSCSVEDKFIPKIEYFEKVGFEYRDSILMFRRFPQLFCYSVKENFEPKFNYFVVEMGRELKELKEFPHYFSFSLEKRIKPRHQRCVENGVCLPLSGMLKMREEVFRQRLDVCCNSSMPRSNSPLWCANNCDVDKLL